MATDKVKSQGGYPSLSAKISQSGSARVIVGLDTPFQPMAVPLSDSSLKQMGRISSAQDSLLSELSFHKIAHYHKYSYIPYMVLEVDDMALEALMASNLVLGIEEDIPEPANLDLSVPRVGAPNAWVTGYTGAEITVAVLDTGVDKYHPYLAGAVVSEACYSSNVSGDGATTVCPGGVTSSIATGSARPYAGNCPAGECDHGTHVAGIIAGRQGVAGSPGPGVAPGVNIIAIQVFSRFDNLPGCGASCVCSTSPCTLTYHSDNLKGLERVYALRSTYNISSVNMSLGGDKYSSQDACDTDHSARKAAIDNLRSAGIATVISSGNDHYCGFMGAPGCISTAVSIGAANDADAVANYSNSASFLKLLAPGSDILSSVPGGGYASWNGTSMAAPHVTGAWALMKEAKPTATVDQILTAFTNTGLPVTDAKCPSVTKKRININEALASLKTLPYVKVNPASGVGQTSANLSGAARANNDSYAATITFQYGATTSYGSSVASTPGSVLGSSDTAVSAALTGLSPNTLYHFRIKGTSRYGTTYSDDMTFVTSGTCADIINGGLEGYPPLPPWQDISSNCGTPLCNVFDDQDCPVHSGYGAAEFGCFTASPSNPEIGSLSQNITIPAGSSPYLTFYLWNVQPSYNFDDYFSVLIDGSEVLAVMNDDLLFTGGYVQTGIDLSPYANGGSHALSFYSAATDSSFFGLDDISMVCSKGQLPEVRTVGASGITGTEATLTGTVNAYGNQARVYFDYGEQMQFGLTTNAFPMAVALNANYPVSAKIAWLAPGTLYNYRVRAKNSSGMSYGRNLSFFTHCPSGEARIGQLSPWASIQTAINAAIDQTMVKVNSAEFTEEDLTFNKTGTVYLTGGYDCTFSSTPGFTTVHGKLTFYAGSIVIKNLVVQ